MNIQVLLKGYFKTEPSLPAVGSKLRHVSLARKSIATQSTHPLYVDFWLFIFPKSVYTRDAPINQFDKLIDFLNFGPFYVVQLID